MKQPQNVVLEENDNELYNREVNEYKSLKSRFSLDPLTVILIISLVIVVVYGTIQMYTIYTNQDLQKQVIQYAVDTNAMLEIQFTDNTAIAFNVTPANAPSSLNKSTGSARTVRVIPRGYITEYYKQANGIVITPYSVGDLVY